MTGMNTRILCLMLSALPSLCLAQAPSTVRVEGAVAHPGDQAIQPERRLADVVVQAQPAADAYLLGSSYLRRQALVEQVRLRAGILHGLTQLQLNADPAVVETAAALQQWVQAHAATGRVPTVISPRLMQVQPQSNPVLMAGDLLRIPVRPDHITVLGAVRTSCTVRHSPQRDARDYLRDCPPSAAADPDSLYIVQPDGRVQKQGIALWNRADPQAVAPGGSIYVPLRESVLKSIDPAFNNDVATFIATQPVSP